MNHRVFHRVVWRGAVVALGMAALPFTGGVAAEPTRVADLSPALLEHDANIYEFTELGDGLAFEVDDGVHGRELWITDGSATGTRLLRDLLPGPQASAPRFIGQPLSDGRRFFEASTDLWITDGTGDGTLRLAVTCSQCPSFISGEMAGETLLFSRADPQHGIELWRSDGTRRGTRLLKDLNPGVASSSPVRFHAFGDQVLFLARVGQSSQSAWISDGTAEGTQPLMANCVGDCPRFTGSDVTVLGDRLLLYAFDDAHGGELWVTDGTESGTRLLRDIYPGTRSSGPVLFTTLGDRLIFRARDGEHGGEPWVTDGTPEGTRLLGDLQPGNDNLWVVNMETFGNRVVGTCSIPECTFTSDGTPEGTQTTFDWLPGGKTSGNLAVVGETLFFVSEVMGESSLWASDGTSEGTRQLLVTHDFEPRGQTETLLFFTAAEHTYVSDGTPEGTRRLPVTGIEASAALGDLWIFSGPGAGGGADLWKSDGTEQGTQPLADFRSPRGDAKVSELKPWGDRVAFRATDAGTFRPNGLWSSDGQTIDLLSHGEFGSLEVAGEKLFALGAEPHLTVVDADGTHVFTLGEGEIVEDLAALGDRVLLPVSSPGQQVWVSDGTADGTRMLVDLRPGWEVSCSNIGGCLPTSPRYPTAMGDLVFFGAWHDEDNELWVTDGTSDGTRKIQSFGPVTRPQMQSELTYFHPRATSEHLFFWVETEAHGVELWVSDGSTDGTRMVEDLAPGPASSRVRVPTVLGERIIFGLASEATTFGDDLWIADAQGADMLIDLEPNATVHEMVASGDRVFLSIDSLHTGRALWVSDGTAVGTRRIGFEADPAEPGVQNLTPIPGGVFFAASDGTTGLEPWVSFGEPWTTGPLGDLFPGESASSPGPAQVADGKLYFEADDGVADRELFVVNLDDLAVNCPANQTCLDNGRFAVEVRWRDHGNRTGFGQEVVTSQTSVLQWFFQPDNWELLVKVIDGCAANGHYWVFAAGATDVEYTLTVRDLLTGETWSYFNPLGERSPAVTAIEALESCPYPGVRARGKEASPVPGRR